MQTHSETPARLLRIRGLVQGVGYRNALHREATRLGLSGWVRNRSDGSVEALISGPAEAVDTLTGWAHRGPPQARVDRVTWQDEPGDPGDAADGFKRRPTL